MKRTTQFVAAALVAVLTLSGLSVLAAEEQAAPAKRAGHPFAAGSGMQHKAQFRGRGNAGQGWSRKELTQEEKTARLEARKAALAARLEAGKITQEQYDEMLAKIEAGGFGFQFKGRDNNKQVKRHDNSEKTQRKELTQEEKTARLEARKAALVARLEAGKITQEQYDEMLAKIEAGDFGFRFNGRGNDHNFNVEKPERNRKDKSESDRNSNFGGFQRGRGKGMGHRMHKGAPAENTAEN